MAQIETRAHLVQVVTKTGDEDHDPEAKIVFSVPVDEDFIKLLQFVRNYQRDFKLKLTTIQETLPGLDGEPVGAGSARVFPNGGRG